MEAIATEAVKQSRTNLSAPANEKEVKAFLNDQKSTILLYLPAALNMGTLLNDNVLDDQTNKMQGPLSSLIQSIGNAFSGPVMDDDTKKV
jgi:lysozyme family protein